METALNEAASIVLPAAVQAIGVVLAALLAWLTVQVQKRTGLAIEAERRDALHSAIMTGVAAAAKRLGEGAAPSLVAKEAVDYARRSVPDAIAALRPDAQVLTNLAMAKLEQLVTTRPEA